MDKVEIFDALALLENTVIKASVAVEEALDQIDKLKRRIQEDLSKHE